MRICSARYSVPRELLGRDVEVIAAEGQVFVEHDTGFIARHAFVHPVLVTDEHYGDPDPAPDPSGAGPLPLRVRRCSSRGRKVCYWFCY